MKQYQELEHGGFLLIEGDRKTSFNPGSQSHTRMLDELDAVPPLATVNLYVAPPPLPPILSLQEEVEALREAIETSGSATLKEKLRTNRETKLLSKDV